MNTKLTPQDREHLTRAIELGRRGWGKVHPNPMVGCVLVREGEVVGEGWHREYGGPHAEVHAVAQAGDRSHGSTAYLSLEPCNHHGKTPPCSTALLAAGISRLVYAAPDPGQISGGGAEALRREGVEVVGPVLLPQEFREENPAFYHNQVLGSTFVALKLAQTLDGKISEGTGRRTTITGPQARFETHRLRAGFDGIMVGSKTVMVDDPLLTVREAVPMRSAPARVILDTRARLSPKANVFRDVAKIPLIIFTGEDASELAIEDLEAAGAKVHPVPRTQDGVSIQAVLSTCHEIGLRSLFCEGGGRLTWTLMREGLAQRLYLFVAPFVLGEKGVPAFPDGGPRDLWDQWIPALLPATFGRDVLLTLDRTA
jgi:diaminohydroxyphosphoribosylaminopyrimidine deaminase/5-amino-6-(5-phosphoribosylamino)uracil reductase